MRHNLLLCLCICFATIVNAESHSLNTSHNQRLLIGRELRRSGGGGRSSYSNRTGTRSSYASSYSSPSTSKYSGKSGYYTYMGTLTYYNSYYSRDENCLDYLENDYCTGKDASNRMWKGIGSFVGIFLCVACICFICNYSCITDKCCCKKKDREPL